jgi:copper chaperone
MNELKFKSNINCGSCVKAVTSTLNNSINLEKWSVDLQSENRVLTVQGPQLNEKAIVAELSEIGFDLELLS